MSASSATTRPEYRVNVTSGPRDVVTIYDSSGGQVARDVHSVSVTVPRGLYTIRTEFAAEMRDQDVKIDGPLDLVLPPVDAYSAAPLTDAVTSHEYYTDPSIHCSNQPTRPPLIASGGPPASRMMLFFRALASDAPRDTSFANVLSLCDANGNHLSNFGPATTARDDAAGWLAFSADASPGLYRLHHDGKTPREIALRLEPSWATYWFVMIDAEPRFDNMSVVMAHPAAGFAPNDDSARAIDLGLWSLQNGVTAFPRTAMSLLLTGKFDNPLMGLIGVWLLLRKPKVTSSELIAPLANLQSILGESPDVIALENAVSRRFPADYTLPLHPPLSDVPMLRASLEALVDASVDRDDVIAEGSLLDRITSNRYTDSSWTTWKPLTADAQKEEFDWVDYAVYDALSSAAKTGWLSTIELQDLARVTRLPQRTVLDRVRKLRAATSPSVEKFLDSNAPTILSDMISKTTF
jgi:hypothetical protein